MKLLAVKLILAGFILSGVAAHEAKLQGDTKDIKPEFRHKIGTVQLQGGVGGAASGQHHGHGGGHGHHGGHHGGSSSSFHTEVIRNGAPIVHHHSSSSKHSSSSSGEVTVESWVQFVKKYTEKITGFVSQKNWNALAQWLFTASKQPDFPVKSCSGKTSGTSGSTRYIVIRLQGINQDDLQRVLLLNQKSQTGSDGWWDLLVRLGLKGQPQDKQDQAVKLILQIITKNQKDIRDHIKKGDWSFVINLLNKNSKDHKINIDWSKVLGPDSPNGKSLQQILTHWSKLQPDQAAKLNISDWLKPEKKQVETVHKPGDKPHHPHGTTNKPGDKKPTPSHPHGQPGHPVSHKPHGHVTPKPHGPHGKPGHQGTTAKPGDKKPTPSHPHGHPGSVSKKPHGYVTGKPGHPVHGKPGHGVTPKSPVSGGIHIGGGIVTPKPSHPIHVKPGHQGTTAKPGDKKPTPSHPHGHPGSVSKKPHGHVTPSHPVHGKPGHVVTPKTPVTGGIHIGGGIVTPKPGHPTHVKPGHGVTPKTPVTGGISVHVTGKPGHPKPHGPVHGSHPRPHPRPHPKPEKVKQETIQTIVKQTGTSKQDLDKAVQLNKQGNSGADGWFYLITQQAGGEKSPECTKKVTTIVDQNEDTIKEKVKKGDWKGLIIFLNEQSKKQGVKIDWSKVLGDSKDSNSSFWRMILMKWASTPKQQASTLDLDSWITGDSDIAANRANSIILIIQENQEEVQKLVKQGDTQKLQQFLEQKSKEKGINADWKNLDLSNPQSEGGQWFRIIQQSADEEPQELSPDNFYQLIAKLFSNGQAQGSLSDFTNGLRSGFWQRIGGGSGSGGLSSLFGSLGLGGEGGGILGSLGLGGKGGQGGNGGLLGGIFGGGAGSEGHQSGGSGSSGKHSWSWSSSDGSHGSSEESSSGGSSGGGLLGGLGLGGGGGGGSGLLGGLGIGR